MAELVRVARPGGTVVVSAPNRLRLNYLLDPPGVVRGRLFPQHRGYRRRYQTAATLGALLRHAGLIDVVVVGHGVGRFTIAGYPLGSEAAAVAIDRCLGRRLPSRAAARLGADLVACARVAG
jgi:pimeloyl-ACP methyl ester carboxylesterase